MAVSQNAAILARLDAIETATLAIATAVQALTMREVSSVAAEAPASPKATTATTAKPKAKAQPKAADVVTCCATKSNGKRCMQRYHDKALQTPLVSGRCQYHQDAVKYPAAYDGIVTIPAPVAEAPASPKATTATTVNRPTCNGVKADGTDCSSVIVNDAGYCKHHAGQAKPKARNVKARTK